jgi:hypothetical protein
VSKPIYEGAKFSTELPDELKLAIADCITLHSKIEAITIEILWILEAADLNRKRQIGTRRASLNTEDLRKVIEAIPGAVSDAIWETREGLSEERHIIAHGVWGVVDRNKPYVVWHKWIDTNEGVVSEAFPYARFDYFIECARALLKTFADFKALLSKNRNKRKLSQA